MKPFCSRALLLHTNPDRLQRPFRFLQVHHFSAAPSHNSLHGNQKRQEEDSRNVRISVWWDFRNCGIPAGVNEFKIAHAITTAIRTNGMKGPVQITAFGDVSHLSRNGQQALYASGINIVHIPNGGKNSADRFLLMDLLYWISQNPPPAHLLLISGDKDFAGILHKLRMSNYNILIASQDNPPPALCCAASISWEWSSLVKGEDFNGKIYNQPPDGPYNSWYGHYRRPLEDPFAVEEKQVLSKAKVVECKTEPKIPSIKTVLVHVKQILSSRPNGISTQELEVELRKVHLYKDYYGCTTIAEFLEAIPHIAKLNLQSDGTYMVQPVTGPVHAPSELDVGGSAEHVENKEVKCSDDLKVQIGREHDSGDRNEKRSSESLQEVIPEGNSSEVEVQEPKPEEGVVRKFWKRWFSSSHDVSNIECKETPKQIPAAASVKCVSSEDKSDKGAGKEGESYDTNASNLKELDSPSDGSANTEHPSAGFEKYDDKSDTPHTSLFKRAAERCMFWRVDDKPEISSEGSDDGTVKQEQISHAAINEIFSKDGFWSEMKSFLESPAASVVFQSTTRAAMSENLQKVGPECLKTLSQSELLHLVDLLISEKKFVKEQRSLQLPFKLASRTSSANASLASIFKSKQDGGGETVPGQKHIPLHAALKKKGPERSRDEILADCKKLVNEVMKGNPDGYNIGLFKKEFLEKYRYPLDLQLLGYQKVSDLVQLFPGVNISAGHIVPSSSSSSISKTLVASIQEVVKEVQSKQVQSKEVQSKEVQSKEVQSKEVQSKEVQSKEVQSKQVQSKEVQSNVLANPFLKKQEDDSSAWEELGPASDESVGKGGYYEPVVIEDDFSESEEERRLTRHKDDDVSSYGSKGSLLEILAVHNNDGRVKDGGNGNSKLLSVDEMEDRMIRTRFNKPRQVKKVYSFVTDDKQKPKITAAAGK